MHSDEWASGLSASIRPQTPGCAKMRPMLTYPDINPVALALGPIKVHWYGLMYLIGFGAFWALGRYRARRPDSAVTTE